MNIKSIKRKPIIVSSEQLIKSEFINEKRLPLVIQPAVEGIDLATWIVNNRQWLEAQLFQYGGILFRNFNLTNSEYFQSCIQAISSELIEYSYRSTPRSQVSGKIYTSTEYPAAESISLHNEMAYSRSWPMKIGFFCVKVAEQGGETPIADSRKVLQQIHPTIREKFIEKKVMYVRNYGQGLDLDWKTVFQSNQKSEVENYCREARIEFEWLAGGNHLRTRQVCQAVATHPKTGDAVWFNQAHLFHVSSLKLEVRESLLTIVKAEDLPRNAYYGDGSEIEDSVLAEINEIYWQEAVMFPWQAGDILILDNMLTAHGRKPFVGSRKVLVGMAEPYSLD